jgi:hypothetical protein
VLTPGAKIVDEAVTYPGQATLFDMYKPSVLRLSQNQVDRQPGEQEKAEHNQLHKGHPTVMDDIQFMWIQVEHAAVQIVDHAWCEHEETEPDEQQQKAEDPASK